jgi:hypothetical protein
VNSLGRPGTVLEHLSEPIAMALRQPAHNAGEDHLLRGHALTETRGDCRHALRMAQLVVAAGSVFPAKRSSAFCTAVWNNLTIS